MEKRSKVLLTALVLTAVIVSGVAGYGLANWGHRSYYAKLDANMSACATQAGVTTCEDAHNVIYNRAMVWLQHQFANADPSGGGTMKFIALSNNGGAPAAGTNALGDGCGVSEGGTELTTNGAARATGTITYSSVSASPQTQTVDFTFTATGAGFTAQKSCLMNLLTPSGVNDQQFATATFTSATLASGDTLKVTWTLTWTF